jgi:hypothetical protein
MASRSSARKLAPERSGGHAAPRPHHAHRRDLFSLAAS